VLRVECGRCQRKGRYSVFAHSSQHFQIRAENHRGNEKAAPPGGLLLSELDSAPLMLAAHSYPRSYLRTHKKLSREQTVPLPVCQS
jgi:hypothetical protein